MACRLFFSRFLIRHLFGCLYLVVPYFYHVHRDRLGAEMRVGYCAYRRSAPRENQTAHGISPFRIPASQNQSVVIPAVQSLFPVERAKPVFLGFLASLDLVEIFALERNR